MSIPAHKRLGMYLSYGKDLQNLIVNWINLTYDFDIKPISFSKKPMETPAPLP
jgi:hypothetical protein